MLTKQEQRQQISEYLADARSDYERLGEELGTVRSDLKTLKEDRDATQRSLADFDRLIRETRAKYERVMESQSQIQADINKFSGQIDALGV